MWRHEDIYLSAIGGGGNPPLGIAPVTDLGRRRGPRGEGLARSPAP